MNLWMILQQEYFLKIIINLKKKMLEFFLKPPTFKQISQIKQCMHALTYKLQGESECVQMSKVKLRGRCRLGLI